MRSAVECCIFVCIGPRWAPAFVSQLAFGNLAPGCPGLVGSLLSGFLGRLFGCEDAGRAYLIVVRACSANPWDYSCHSHFCV